MKLVFNATVTDGVLKISGLTGLQPFEGKKLEVTIEKNRVKRSYAQNRYLHALFTIFKNELNALGNEFTSEEIKDLCKAKFALIDVVNESTGECIGQRIQGTSEMTKEELGVFIDNVIRWAAEYFSIVLPVPNTEFEINFKP